MISKKNIAAIALALMAGVSTASAQTLLWSDDFNDNDPIGWENNSVPPFNEVNHQFAIRTSFPPTPLANPRGAIAYGRHPIALASLPDQQTLEMRVDLVGANQNDALAAIQFFWAPEYQGYLFFKDQDEVWLMKMYNGTESLASFFWEKLPLKNQNVTLVLALTPRGSDLRITTRVLDKDKANAVLFERTVTDTPQADPVLPSGAVKGFKGEPDVAGTPLPGANATAYYVQLALTWGNSEHASQPAAEVIFDNLEVWQYESPELKIQNAIVLSWPVTQGKFVLESASSVNGPWEQLPEPWSRIKDGKTEVSILAPDSLKLFRLRYPGFPSYIPFDRAQGEIPEGVAVDNLGNVYVAVGGPGGPRNGQIWKFTSAGDKSVLIDFGTPGVTGLTADAMGNVYVARDVAPNNGVFRVDPAGHAIRLPGTEQIVMANSMAFDPEGNLFVTESFSFDPPLTPYAYTNYIAPAFGRGGIWRIPPQGTAELWLRDDLLSGTGSLAFLLPYPCGANGIGYYENAVYVANTERGLVLRIPVLPNGGPGAIETVAQVPDPDPTYLSTFGPPVPDGLALDSQGNIYVPVINRNAVVRISPDGSAWKTLTTAADRLDAPASLAFGTTPGERTSLFVTSLSMIPGFAGPSLVKIEAGISGLPLP